MPADMSLTWVTYLTRASGAVILAVLLFNFHRRHQRGYLRHWTWSWVSLSIYYLTSALAIQLIGREAPADIERLLASGVASVAGYLQVGWLLFGAAELLRRRHVRLRMVQMVLPALALFGLAITFVSAPASVDPRWRVFLRVGIYGLLAGLAFLTAAWFCWRAADRRTSGFGVKLMAVAFALYGVVNLDYFVVTSPLMSDRGSSFVSYLGFGDFIFIMLMGLGMVTALLEDEREAANLALYEIEHIAYHDPLTGLPNRPLFMDRLIVAVAHASRYQRKLAVFFIDLDRFKQINDTLGHSSGDALLRSVAERLSPLVRGQDTLARFGADEFALLIQDLDQVEHAARLAERFLSIIRAPYHLNGIELFASSTIGISFFPDDGDDAETLVKNADTAMNRAKEQERDSYRIYSADMNTRALERLALENMLHRAIEQDELVLHYQPLVDLDTLRVFGVEALLRWQHPERGLLYPSDFIPVAELSGQIISIGSWVLETACYDLRRLQKSIDDDFLVSINLSARQFQQPDLAKLVSDAIRESGISSRDLQIEITESNAMKNAEVTIETLEELKRVGVSLSVDDFGTGYSSLEYLKRFPIDTLKLDQTFVRDLEVDGGDSAIATAVIAMAHSLGLKVVAEGVERRGQLDFLRANGCDRIQGYLLSAALPIDELESFLTSNNQVIAV